MDHVMKEMKQWNIEKEVRLSSGYNIKDFVKCVDILIESEYIERNENDSNIIEYAYPIC